ncbi:hypothetical protein [Idiomarina ramblicola]|uniref:CBS domain-containing protein n=1 Tax=Idiomarina ramblicola TaxID=263724 RepID=A0A432YTE5_9GAMM|nr:hypothetical protein [Idiomarina ramblicola]RUO64829.1 hypothetical protein CWI78_11690 [Idiomarina ramblicola]
MSEFKEIQWSSAADKVAIHHASQSSDTLSWHDNALHVMDDFKTLSAVELPESTLVSDAESAMSKTARRYACVKDSSDKMIGLVALRELHGRKATQVATRTQTNWKELTVKELMMPLSALPQVELSNLRKSRIGDVAATLKASGRDFLIVINQEEVFGVISSLRIAQLTGESVNVFHLPSSFAEILSAVNHKEVID